MPSPIPCVGRSEYSFVADHPCKKYTWCVRGSAALMLGLVWLSFYTLLLVITPPANSQTPHAILCCSPSPPATRPADQS
eukprot:1177333-Prorocentrum_minimum.AAC.1